MKTSLVVVPLLALGTYASLGAQTIDSPSECESYTTHVKAVSTYNRTTNVDLTGKRGALDSTPLLTTSVTVGGSVPTCLVAHFSAMVRPKDNHAMFQVTVDNVLMEGHYGFTFFLDPPFGPPSSVPVVSDPEETDMNQQRMVAFNFFKQVRPGTHTIEVHVATCCTAPGGVGQMDIPSAVLTLEFVGTK